MWDSYTLAWNHTHRLVGLFELSWVWNKRAKWDCIVQVCCAWNVSNHTPHAIWKYEMWRMQNFSPTA